MNKNKFFIATMILLVLFTLGTLSAADATDNITLTDSSQDSIAESDETALSIDSSDLPVEEKDNESTAIELIEGEDYNVRIPEYIYSDDPSSIIRIKNMPLDAKGNISIFLNGTEVYNEKVSVGGNGIYLGNLAEGIYNVLINYTGDGKYAGFAKTGVTDRTFLHVNPLRTNLGGIGYVFFRVSLDDGVTGYIEIKVNGKVVYNGKYDPKNPPYHYYNGLYPTYEVRYYNGNHNDKTIKEELSPEDKKVKLVDIPSNLMVNQSDDLIFITPDNSEGDLVLSGMINDTIKVCKGANYIPISSETVGSHILKLTYKNYTWTKNIKVRSKSDLNINYPKSMNYGQDRQITLDDYHNATLVLYISEYIYDDCILPIAQFDLNQIKEISLNRTFLENALNNPLAEAIIKYHYKTYESNFILITGKIYSDYESFDNLYIYVYFDAKFTGFKNVAQNYLESKTMKITVCDIFGNLAGKDKKVTLKIGSKTYSAKTDKNSVAKFKIPNTLTPGKYTMEASYKLIATKKLTVNHIVTLKSVGVKKSAKKLTLQATLKKVNGKYLKNKAVTFKFNGKTYKAKTNSKGIAKVTVKSNVLKKLKVGKKVTYQATYLKDTVKKTTKVKK